MNIQHMKQTKKYIITMAALLLSVTTLAQGKFTYIYQLNGASSTAAAAGTISGEISENGTATLTLTPAQGNYINADYITVVKTLNGGNAQTRIGTAENVSITASNANADPSETTTYTFAVEDANYDYEVTANFQSRTNISSATVALAATSYTYDGQEHKPAVSSVKLGEKTLGTNDYTVSYADDCTNVGTVTVTIAGARTYTGTTTATYSITNATMTVTANGYTGAYDGKAHGITVTTSESATIKYGTKKGTYDLDASPTYTDAGSYMVHYQVERTNYTTIADSAKVEITKATPSITFDKESYSTTYGETFTAPTPSTNPEGLTVAATSSSNTQVATVADGIITIVGTGETTITVSFAGNNNYEDATATYKLNVAAGSITGITATGFTGTYDGKAHGITVTIPEGTTIKYGTKKGTYDLDASPTYTDAGSYMVHYQVERTNFTTIADSAKVEITKATPSITFDKESYSATYGETFTAPTPSTNPEGLTIAATSSSNTQVATVANGIITSVGTGETTITVSFAGNNNYEAATATYKLNVAAGTITGVTATGYTGTYDGKAHGITVSAPEGTTIKYGTKKGTYDLDASPTYTDAGSYMVHYQVERTNYNTIADSAKVEITKATPSITFDKESYSATYGEEFTAPTPSTNPEGLTVTATSSSNTQVATITDGVIKIVGIGETTITVSFAGNTNYEAATATYKLNVAAGAITGITATGFSGTYDGKVHGITVTVPEGATIKYGTKKGTYDLDASPTYTDAGSYMVHYQVERTNYTTIADSAKVEITKATPSITFDKDSYSATYGETFNAPTPSTSPEGLDVTATNSSNTQVATITDGVIKIVGIGETTITVSFAGNTNYEAATATYILNVAAGTSTDVIATGYSGVYDGKAHGITVSAPDGSTIKYGTEKGKYELDKSPTYTDAGTYWIHYQVERTNYATIADSAKVAITKATPSITFEKDSYSTTYGETFSAPIPTTSPEGLTVTATASSNTNVATVTDGVIEIVGIGETTITVSFAGNNNYEKATATYVLMVNKPKAKTYDLWIGETQVTEDNAEDILDAGNNPELPLYIYNAKTNTLIISKDQRGTAVIESRLPELKVYLLEICKIKRIFYNNLDDEANTGTLTFTCNGNVPGKLYIENNEGESAITGFSDISYEYQLTVIEPDSTVYRKEQMMYAEKDEEGNPTGNFIVANKVTIGQTIVPTTKEETITFSEDQLVEKDEEGNVKTDEEGNPISADLSNFTYAPTSETGEDSQPKILITLNPESGDGYGDDDGEGGIYVVNGTSDDKVNEVADGVANEEYVPGGSTYAANYDGFTFILPAGEGSVTIDEEVDEGYEFHLKIGTDAPITLKEGEPGRAQAEISFSVEEPTYCYLYMVEAHTYARAAARPYDDTRVGKRPQAHGKIFSVKVSPSKLNAANTPSQASGGVIPPSQEQGDIMEFEGIQGVKVVQTTDDRWFTIDGRQIDKPTQKGLYIHNRKKVVVK